MLGFCVLAPMGDALAKIIGLTVPLGILLLVRFGVQAVILVPLAIVTKRPLRLSGRILRLAWVRTCLHIIGIGAMFTALRHLPLADAVAIAFVMPFLMLMLGHFVLGEEIGVRRIIACFVGFVGTLLVIQPAFASVGWPALWPLLVAVVFSLFMLVTRQMAKTVDPIGLQAVNGVMAVCILVPAIAAFHVLGAGASLAGAAALVRPEPQEVQMLIAIGIIGTAAHLLMTWSLRYAPSATLAPMQYLEIPFATLIGWFVFAEWPNALASLGIVVTIGSGLYIVMRERAIAQAAPPAV